LLDGHRFASEEYGVRRERGAKRGLERGAVDDDQGRSEAAFELVGDARAERLARPGTKRSLGRPSPAGLDRVADAEPAQRQQGVRPEGDPGADLAELDGPLEHVRVDARSAQRNRRGQAADACSDDDRPWLAHANHRTAVVAIVASAISPVVPETTRVVLYGRGAECERVERLLAGARGGRSGALVVRGEPGIGKSALLSYAEEHAEGMQILRARGVESETELSFAGLHQALRPVIDRLELLPAPQAAALATALGLAEARQADRFLIGAAVLSVLAEAAEERPVLCLVDDLHWLDGPSADALLFAARRLEAEPIAMLFAARDDGAADPRLDELHLQPLDGTAAGALVAATVEATLTDHLRKRILERAHGNPLALIELAATVPPEQLAGEEPLDELQLTATVERAFLGRVRGLPESSQRLLLLAAADEIGELGTLLRAADALGIEPEALPRAERAGLLRVDEQGVEFSHPLVRSAVYQAATSGERQAAHRALADALTGDQADRRAWHRAAAAVAPDEEVAGELERAAERARRRGAHAAAAAALEKAAAFTAEQETRGRRLADAAEAAWEAGAREQARSLSEQAAVLAADPLLRGRIEHLRGTIEARRGVVLDGYRILSDGAAEVGEVDPVRAAAMLAEAASAASYGGDVQAIAAAGRRAAALPSREEPDFSFDTKLLTGTSAVLERDPARGVPVLREAMALAEKSGDPSRLVRAGVAATYAGDDRAARDYWLQAAREARTRGALGSLSFALEFVAIAEATAGRYAQAFADASEGLSLARELGLARSAAMHLATAASVRAIEGREEECRRLADEALALATRHGLGLVAANASAALARLDLGLGRPAEALTRLEALMSAGPGSGHPLVALFATPDLVEAALRADRIERAQTALATYEQWATASALPWALAVLARSRGLLSAGRAAHAHFEEAVTLHAEGERPFDHARTRLLFGEFLRRERRRVEARPHLRAAAEIFERLGAQPWAERAASELRASGETARRREPGAGAELTAQEMQIARLVAEGATNKEVAAQLFLSPRTVDYHLRKVFMKVGISSRAELRKLDLAG
jgi:DNA-binding CsgD family transcriptional regulator